MTDSEHELYFPGRLGDDVVNSDEQQILRGEREDVWTL